MDIWWEGVDDGQYDCSRIGRTCWLRTLILSADDSLIDAIDVFVAPISLSGMNVCMISGDSNGLLSDDPSVAFTRNLSKTKI